MLCLNKVLPYENKSYLLLVDQSILYIIKTLACLDKIANLMWVLSSIIKFFYVSTNEKTCYKCNEISHHLILCEEHDLTDETHDLLWLNFPLWSGFWVCMPVDWSILCLISILANERKLSNISHFENLTKSMILSIKSNHWLGRH